MYTFDKYCLLVNNNTEGPGRNLPGDLNKKFQNFFS